MTIFADMDIELRKPDTILQTPPRHKVQRDVGWALFVLAIMIIAGLLDG